MRHNSEGWKLIPFCFVIFKYVFSTGFIDILLKKFLKQQHWAVAYLKEGTYLFTVLPSLLAKILKNFVKRQVVPFSWPHQTNTLLIPIFIVGLAKGPLWIYHWFSAVINKCRRPMLKRSTDADITIPQGGALCFNCDERVNQ